MIKSKKRIISFPGLEQSRMFRKNVDILSGHRFGEIKLCHITYVLNDFFVTKQNYIDHNETLSLLNSIQKMFELCLDSSSKSKLD